MSEGYFDPVDSLPPTLTATALAEELAEYEAALAAVHFDGRFDDVPSFEPLDSDELASDEWARAEGRRQAMLGDTVSCRTSLPLLAAMTQERGNTFDLGLVSHVDLVKAAGLLDDEDEDVPPTMRSPSSSNIIVCERPVKVTMEETPSSTRRAKEMLATVKVA